MAVEGKKYTLKSSDAVEFEVEEAVAMESHMIKLMIEDDCANDKIPVPNVTGEILTKVVEYCEKHVDMQKQMDLEDKKAVVVEEDLKAWDAAFVNVDQAVLFHLILAANYLEINSLLDLTIQKVVDIIKGKSPEEIRTIFNIKNDFTPEEEEEIRKENRWAFE